MIKKTIRALGKLLHKPVLDRLGALEVSLEVGHINQARQIVAGWGDGRFKRIRDAEFKVFSQWGEDGIIQYLITRVPIPNKTFVEFGVEDYKESNTRLLLLKDDWRGLVLDGDNRHIASIKKRDWAWRHHLDAVPAFITAENINSLIGGAGLSGDVGLLSVDVDGNDYWLWKALTVIQPRIVVVEYNGLWGEKRAVTVPYDPAFVRSEKHYSNLYYGASLSALCQLADEKGYVFAGSNSTGLNAFFVRRDCAMEIPVATIADEYIFRRFREGRKMDGSLALSSHEQQIDSVAEMKLFDVVTERLCVINEILN
jgi:hypothetical protein